ncbi:MAG: methylenetetrahydrofolate reductase C-terminal domain-containing protein [Candidatus Vecturithrix sp.]|jgi:ferredoxin|nr:methylenetetrahydrofolate reductase C-terminal domain-containing protein [Candidatus Vecturithrix sp.]
MITAVQKPFEEIITMVQGYEKLLILGCGSCVTVCMAGGEKEVGILASTLRLAYKKQGRFIEIQEATITRQCDREFFDEVKDNIAWADAVLSLACGVGVQFCSEVFPGKCVLPALNTKFYGTTEQQGIWSERCGGCGNCVLADFGGICPIARCSKSLLNGPCGGSVNGKCEVDPENLDCAWQLIWDRMSAMGLVHKLEEMYPIKDWSTGRDGGPGKIIREDMLL